MSHVNPMPIYIATSVILKMHDAASLPARSERKSHLAASRISGFSAPSLHAASMRCIHRPEDAQSAEGQGAVVLIPHLDYISVDCLEATERPWQVPI